jgi:chromosomal replication initiation ATPase DnaA
MCDIAFDPRKLNLENLLQLACDARGITVETSKKKCRKREITEARFAFFILAKDMLDLDPKTIGKPVGLGRCDVIHALKNLREIPEIDKVVQSVKSLYY